MAKAIPRPSILDNLEYLGSLPVRGGESVALARVTRLDRRLAERTARD